MTTDKYLAYIQDLLITIHEHIRELRERRNFADPEELLQEIGL